MFINKDIWTKTSCILFLGMTLGAYLLAGSARASEQDTRLHYSVYLGGLFLGSIDVDVSQTDHNYTILSTASTNQAFNLLINWIARGETKGLVDLDKFLPRQHQHKSKWNNNERIVTMDYTPDGSVHVEKVGGRSDDMDKYTPVDPSSLTNSIDPMTAILTVSERLERGEDCNISLPVFDGHRRYDAILSDVPPRAFRPSAYSVFSGTAIGCRIEFQRKGGFPVNRNYDQEQKQDVIVWAGDPSGDGRIVPVRLQLETQFGAMEIHLDRYSDGLTKLVSRNAR
jgi:hypothetical protein